MIKVDRLSRNVFDKRISILYEKALCDQIEMNLVSDGQIINSRISVVEKFQNVKRARTEITQR